MTGIEDTSQGRCDAHVTIRGADYRCDLAAAHEGWAHSSREASAIWSPVPRAGTPAHARSPWPERWWTAVLAGAATLVVAGVSVLGALVWHAATTSPSAPATLPVCVGGA